MNQTPSLTITVDRESDTGYIRLNDAKVRETVELTELVVLDLDEFKMAVGVEVLALSAQIPFTRLHRDYHVPSTTVDFLRLIQPTLGKFLADVTTGADSTRVETEAVAHGRHRAHASS
jgi:uncharacterized protein YuzE